MAVCEYYRIVKGFFKKHATTEKESGFWMKSDQEKMLKYE